MRDAGIMVPFSGVCAAVTFFLNAVTVWRAAGRRPLSISLGAQLAALPAGIAFVACGLSTPLVVLFYGPGRGAFVLFVVGPALTGLLSIGPAAWRRPRFLVPPGLRGGRHSP